ncbi:hypothetical protein D9758_018429 [Tetrapyrgos nigripes]|uniref:HMG box domain-containing protein n=1 Tax=Tetrapyrgos nigripes TaxID=182062 RepID=A0A8H5C3K2_9AGAR|nr:hypothetical protein D9758_018429 [Tetrapyrgos nigripes]
MPVERSRTRRTGADGTQLVWTMPSTNSPTAESTVSFASTLTPITFSHPGPDGLSSATLPVQQQTLFPFVDESSSPFSTLTPASFASSSDSDDAPSSSRNNNKGSSSSSHSKKKPENHIPRPPNAFILFRSSFIRSQHVSTRVETNHSTLSKIIGLTWHNLPEDEKQVWHARAKVAFDEHKKKFPEYSFRPAHSSSNGDDGGGGKGGKGKAKAKAKAKVKSGGGKKVKTKAEPDVYHADADLSDSYDDSYLSSYDSETDIDSGYASNIPSDPNPPKKKRKVRELGTKDLKRCAKIAQLLVEGKKGSALDSAIIEFDKTHVPEPVVARWEKPITEWSFRKKERKEKERKMKEKERDRKKAKQVVERGMTIESGFSSPSPSSYASPPPPSSYASSRCSSPTKPSTGVFNVESFGDEEDTAPTRRPSLTINTDFSFIQPNTDAQTFVHPSPSPYAQEYPASAYPQSSYPESTVEQYSAQAYTSPPTPIIPSTPVSSFDYTSWNSSLESVPSLTNSASVSSSSSYEDLNAWGQQQQQYVPQVQVHQPVVQTPAHIDYTQVYEPSSYQSYSSDEFGYEEFLTQPSPAMEFGPEEFNVQALLDKMQMQMQTQTQIQDTQMPMSMTLDFSGGESMGLPMAMDDVLSGMGMYAGYGGEAVY